MHDLPYDYLTTYDPDYLEQHTDSSDFEGTYSPVIESRNIKHKTVTRVFDRSSKEEKEFLNQKISQRNHVYSRVYCESSKELWSTRETVSRDTTEVDFKVEQTYCNKHLDSPTQVHTSKPKCAVRHKIIPSLSNIFRRSSNNVKQMLIIKENQAEGVAVNNGSQQCADGRRRKMGKVHRQQCYAVQPVYVVKRKAYGAPIPYEQTRITQSPVSNLKTYKNEYTDYHQGISDSEHEIIQARKIKRKKSKKKKYKKVKSDEQQYPSKQVLKYQIFTYPYQHVACSTAHSDGQRGMMASTSSGFWEHLLEKFNRKSHPHKPDMFACACQTPPVTQTRGAPDHYEFGVAPNVQPGTQYRPQQMSNESCVCDHSNDQKCQKQLLKSKLATPPESATPPEVVCQCYKKKAVPTNSQTHAGGITTPTQEASPCNVCRRCQQPHVDIAQILSKKYNGEILCIHNPPCVLINGCLNLSSKVEKDLNVWPVIHDNDIHQNGRVSQYPEPCYDVRQSQIPEHQTEKIVQSVCNHSPPCEVIRTCVKPKYDPILQNPCIHVPMCEKIPECMVETSQRNCDHEPKCMELPICTRNYIMLTATEDAATQAKPGDQECRHEPPCVMIPKCFARYLYHSCVPFDSIPDCMHRPMCEMIPACCRKSNKEMVSVYS